MGYRPAAPFGGLCGPRARWNDPHRVAADRVAALYRAADNGAATS